MDKFKISNCLKVTNYQNKSINLIAIGSTTITPMKPFLTKSPVTVLLLNAMNLSGPTSLFDNIEHFLKFFLPHFGDIMPSLIYSDLLSWTLLLLQKCSLGDLIYSHNFTTSTDRLMYPLFMTQSANWISAPECTVDPTNSTCPKWN